LLYERISFSRLGTRVKNFLIWTVVITNFEVKFFNFFFSQRCTCGQGLKYEKESELSCNRGCGGNTNGYGEYCGGDYNDNVYATGIF
jgi:hypothetical protein